MEEEGPVEEEEGPVEVFGVHRLELAPSTKSGYIGVRPTNSQKRPWQAWLSLRGQKRRNVGSFKTPWEKKPRCEDDGGIPRARHAPPRPPPAQHGQRPGTSGTRSCAPRPGMYPSRDAQHAKRAPRLPAPHARLP